MSSRHPTSAPPHSDPVPIRRGRARFVLRWRKWLKPFIARNGAPEALAGGLAIGSFVAFTPTLGFQILIAYCIATLFRASRTAAILPVWITTPLTATPIYLFTYKIGTFFIEGPSITQVRRELTQLFRRIDRHDTFDLPSRLHEAMAVGTDIYLPMLLGGVLTGLCCAALIYPATLQIIRRLRAHRKTARRIRLAEIAKKIHWPKTRS